MIALSSTENSRRLDDGRVQEIDAHASESREPILIQNRREISTEDECCFWRAIFSAWSSADLRSIDQFGAQNSNPIKVTPRACSAAFTLASASSSNSKLHCATFRQFGLHGGKLFIILALDALRFNSPSASNPNGGNYPTTDRTRARANRRVIHRSRFLPISRHRARNPEQKNADRP